MRATSASELETGQYSLVATQLPPLPQIGVPATLNRVLTTSDEKVPGNPDTYKQDFRLVNVTPGQTVTVRQESTAIDCFLYLIDAVDGSILDANDDHDEFSTDSQLTFTVEAGREYVIRASSYDAEETGSFTLSTF